MTTAAKRNLEEVTRHGTDLRACPDLRPSLEGSTQELQHNVRDPHSPLTEIIDRGFGQKAQATTLSCRQGQQTMNFGNPKTLARKSMVGEVLGASTRAGQTTRQSTNGLALPNYFELDSKSLTAQFYSAGAAQC